MICKNCNGTGYYDLYMENKCPVCHGTGKIEETNEEWFCNLPTWEKAHFLSTECARAMCEQQLKITKRNGIDYWNMWLKQPRKE